MILLPELFTPHAHRNDARRLLSVRTASSDLLRTFFPDGIPEDYYLDQSQVGWKAGGHYHHKKNERFRCTSGALQIDLRFVNSQGESYKATVTLRADEPLFLLIPAGWWHEVTFLEPGSCLHVASSTLYNDATPDEVRALPEGYNESTAEDARLF